MPYLYATALDCSRVAAHVQALTMPEAIRPGLTAREADENSSEFDGEKAVYRDCRYVNTSMKALKKSPMPIEFNQPLVKREVAGPHEPTTTPYPAPCGKTSAGELDITRAPQRTQSSYS